MAAAIAGYWTAGRNAPPPAMDGVAPGPAGATAAFATVGPSAITVPASGMPPPAVDLARPAPDFAGEPATESLLFHPAAPQGEPRTGGLCDRGSLIAPRPDAYLCTVDNVPYDPCYTVEGAEKLVVCNARPTFEGSGFLLRLIQPPGENRDVEPPDEPWIVGLDETTCERIMGLQLLKFGDKPLRYGCRDGTYVVELDRSRPAWAAQLVGLRIPPDAEPVLETARWVPVRRAWR